MQDPQNCDWEYFDLYASSCISLGRLREADSLIQEGIQSGVADGDAHAKGHIYSRLADLRHLQGLQDEEEEAIAQVRSCWRVSMNQPPQRDPKHMHGYLLREVALAIGHGDISRAEVLEELAAVAKSHMVQQAGAEDARVRGARLAVERAYFFRKHGRPPVKGYVEATLLQELNDAVAVLAEEGTKERLRGDRKRECRALGRVADAYLMLGANENARANAARGLLLAEQGRHRLLVAQLQLTIGDALVALGKPADARTHFQAAEAAALCDGEPFVDRLRLTKARGRLEARP